MDPSLFNFEVFALYSIVFWWFEYGPVVVLVPPVCLPLILTVKGEMSCLEWGWLILVEEFINFDKALASHCF